MAQAGSAWGQPRRRLRVSKLIGLLRRQRARLRQLAWLGIVAVTAWGLLALPVQSRHGVVMERRLEMRQLSRHYRALEVDLLAASPTAAGQSSGERWRLEQGLRIRHLAGQLADRFPEGTAAAAGEPGALGLIWEQPEQFRAALQRFERASEQLLRSLEGRDGTLQRARLMALRQGCLGCHQAFRVRA